MSPVLLVAQSLTTCIPWGWGLSLSAQFKTTHSLGPFSKTCDQAGQPKIGEGMVTEAHPPFHNLIFSFKRNYPTVLWTHSKVYLSAFDLKYPFNYFHLIRHMCSRSYNISYFVLGFEIGDLYPNLSYESIVNGDQKLHSGFFKILFIIISVALQS
jgi:hypothetical protein